MREDRQPLPWFDRFPSRRPLPRKSLHYATLPADSAPPLIVFVGPDEVSLLDGAHRLEAARLRNDSTVRVTVCTDKRLAMQLARRAPTE